MNKGSLPQSYFKCLTRDLFEAYDLPQVEQLKSFGCPYLYFLLLYIQFWVESKPVNQ